MDESSVRTLLAKQKQFFDAGNTRSLSFRIEQLKKLKSICEWHEEEILEALKKDLNKCATEALASELLVVTEEIDYIIKHLSQWMKPTNVASPLPLLKPGKSSIYSEPFGTVFIVGPWNYPFLLIFSPLVGAICAGNCAIIKPSELAVNTQDLFVKLMNDYFPEEYIKVIPGGATEVQLILKEKLDYIFYTGGISVGKIMMEAAAKHLTPVTLELGGKSPCIVDETADLDYAVRRIVWGKTINAGQTCIAPDYLFIQASCKEAFVKKYQEVINSFYGVNPQESASYGRIINDKHFQRLAKLMEKGRILLGGEKNASNRFIAPTLIDEVSWHDPIMQEEIFGPLLPILTFNNIDELLIINKYPKPLALYFFSKNKQHQKMILERISFGSGCINDCILQVANYYLPFGGVGLSGMGRYHGKFSFETFSHRKSIFNRTIPFDISLNYPPYTPNKMRWIKRLFKWL